MIEYQNLCESLKHNAKMNTKSITYIERKEEYKVTYNELYNEALYVLNMLQSRGMKKGDELVFQINENRTFVSTFWGCILGGIIPVPVSVGKNEEHRTKLLKIWKYLNNPYLITSKNTMSYMTKFEPDSEYKDIFDNIVSNTLYVEDIEKYDEKGIEAEIDPQDIAFIQFSSGSTGDPKGVVLTHYNLVHNIDGIINGAEVNINDSSLSWLPLTHDMGIIGLHMMPMLANIDQYLIPTSLFIRRPILWFKKVDEHRATILCSPNFGYKYFLDYYKPEIAKDWDLSCVKVLFNGAEPISSELCKEFNDVMINHGLKKTAMLTVYGMAEACVGVSIPPVNEEFVTLHLDRNYLNVGDKVREVTEDDKDCVSFVEEGPAIDHCSIRICDDNNNVLGEDRIGNIQLKGKNVTSGYQNNIEATKKAITEDNWLNTGDLGYLRNNSLVVTGRAKEIIFVNGQNVYPYDIERVAEELKGIEMGKIVATSVQNPENNLEEIAIFVLFKKSEEEFAKLALEIKKCINMNMGLDIKYIVPIRKIPKTTSGKIQRVKLGKMFEDGEFGDTWNKVKEIMEEQIGKKDDLNAESDSQDKLLNICRQVLNNDKISINDNFFEWGINSLQLETITEKLDEEYPGKITVTDLFAYPTIAKLSDYLENGDKNANHKEDSVKRKTYEDEDIAIIGMALKLPMANNVEDFWHNIRNGKESGIELPKYRKRDIDNYLQFVGQDLDSVEYMDGCYLDEIDKFDYKLFKVTPKEASLMNPNQRLFLETAWQAIEDAGYTGNKVAKSKTGVYLGYLGDVEGFKYKQMICEIDDTLSSISMAGNLPSIIPSRISYLMDLRGPTMLVDTACSSSLVAVHLACQGILKGDCDMALAGGVKVNIVPLKGARIGMESSDGKARTFDDNADGTGVGEGVGVIVLKPVSKALEDGDKIYSVIKGSAINQDGSSIGITAPNVLAQAEVIESAWKNSGVHPETISYIEAHGTGTKLGDPIEITGLTQAFKKYTDKKQFCAIGSVKTNIGHLFETAGVASLIKASLALKYGELPPTLHFEKPNSEINFENSPVYVNDRLRKWETDKYPRRCGISAFGFSGTNCHTILEESPVMERELKSKSNIPRVFTISARSEKGLKKFIRRYKNFIENDFDINDVCYTSNTGRGHYNYRIVAIVEDNEELKELINKLHEEDIETLEREKFLYGEHKVISQDKEKYDIGEISEIQKTKLSKKANDKLKKYIQSGKTNSQLIEEVNKLYVEGADVNWDILYKDEKLMKANIPLCPLERERCWLEIPGVEMEEEGNLYYTVGFKKEKLQHKEEVWGNKNVVIFKDNIGLSDKLELKLKNSGRNVIEVQLGTNFEKTETNNYIIGDKEEDYLKLFEDLKDREVTDIIHMGTLRNEFIQSIEELECTQRRGVYSLYYLIRAMAQKDMTENIGLVLISDYANSITGDEERIKPENAPMFALGKALDKEFPKVKIRVIDIDKNTTVNKLYDEFKYQQEYRVSYRNGDRYIEEFRNVDIENAKEKDLEIKEEGVYIITGGMGGIGFETAKYLADSNKVKLGLINRSKMPNRSKWDEILSNGEDKKTCSKINAIREIESKGAVVECLSADVSNFEDMKTAVNNMREKYGKIDGVIHGAGVAGDGYIARKEERIVSNVIKPKVYGTWILDYITKDDELDFFVMFSSVSTLLTVQGQGDYSAANSYMDTYAEYRKAQGKRTLTINWVPWKETGMAVNHGVNSDTVFKAIHTDKAMEAFDQVMNKDLDRVLIGQLNFESKMVYMLEKFPFKISRSIKRDIERCRKKLELHVNSTETEKKIAQACREILGIKEIDVNISFLDLGADSIMLTRLSEKLQELFPGMVTVSKIFGHPTVAKLAEYIDKQGEKEPEKVKVQDNHKKGSRDIAIIGMSANLPGSQNPEELWDNVRNGTDQIKELPALRKKDIDNYLIYTGMEPEDIKYIDAGFLDEIDKFDYKFFRITPKEASIMDPNQRLFLESVWATIEDAGYGGKRIKGSNTGIYAGFGLNPKDNYIRMVEDTDWEALPVSIPGNLPAIIPSRISYILDLKGPSILLDTACSSTIVTVHLACKALRDGDCDMAIAGGIKLNLLPIDGHMKLGIESSNGRTRAFDDSSDGTGVGEGVASVMLKPLEKAQEDGDHIYAVIKGSAVNQDGSSAGITAPNASAQKEVLLEAWEDAKINPETISYIEAHGTGTKLGDPIEIEALTEAFRRYTDRKQFCAIGTLKTNIGHLFEASGVAGLIKTAMSLKNKEIAPSMFFEKPNYRINFEESPVYVNTTLQTWEKGETPRRSGISAFGLSGTNCHIVLEEAPQEENVISSTQSGGKVFTLSAKSIEALKNLVERYKVYCKKEIDLANTCYTANTGRDHYKLRLAIIADSVENLSNKLDNISDSLFEGEEIEDIFYGEHKIVSDEREVKAGELTTEDKETINLESNTKIREYVATGRTNEQLLKEICELYAKGADLEWDELYEGEKLKKVSLPTYPFDRHRCWVNVPDANLSEAIETGIYYSVGFIPQVLKEENQVFGKGNVLVLRNNSDKAQNIVDKFRDEELNIIEVLPGKDFQKGANSYTVGNSEEDYVKLFDDLKDKEVTDIVHLMTLDRDSIETIEKLQQAKINSAYSIFHLIKAMEKNDIKESIGMTLISEYVNNASGNETKIISENAMLFGLGKGINKEHSNIQVRCIDIDENTTIDKVYEGIVYEEAFKSCYRDGERYIEEFSSIDMDNVEDKKVDIKDGGTYLITGGMGGIGLALVKRLASKNNINLGLVSRSQMPERELWDDILEANENGKTCRRIKAIREIEEIGSEIICFSGDVSNLEDMERVANSLREKFGRIDGVIHVAGVPGDGNLAEKNIESFNTIINSKVDGTWILDKVTKEDKLDFFIMFSSIATVFSATGQADYIAANAYLDSFGELRKLQGKNTLTFNWVIWKETGMAFDKDMTIDTIFKAIETDTALDCLEEALNKDITRTIVGKLNVESKMVFMLEKSDMKISQELEQLLQILRNRQKTSDKTKVAQSSTNIKLKGREGKGYTEIEQKLAEIAREVLGTEEIDVEESFFDLGADSLLLSQMSKKLKELYPGKVSVAKIFAYPTIAKLSEYLSEFDKEKTQIEEIVEDKKSTSRDIAIIGISSKLPMAGSKEEFWNNIRNSVDSIKHVPKTRRKDVDNYLAYSGRNLEEIEYVEAGYLDEIDKFDHKFFRITPKEASLMDPNQRLFLETVWSAIEDAGYGGNKISGTNTGMYAGFENNFRDNYGRMVSEVEPESLAMAVPGNLSSIIPSRVSYALDLKGPSILVGTACSSALVAIHLASKALREGECEMAIAGGVKTNLIPIVNKAKLGIESSNNRTRAFDDGADGTGIGEGVGAVLLKPLDKAQEDGDQIYAVIKGSAINQDGNSAGITAPNAMAQTEVILNAWKDARINPETISYIESHGTGTTLGDPIEIEGLTEAFRKYTDRKQFCAIGSVKTNIGHLFEASGVASLIKAVMSLKNEELPPIMHFEKPNHRINFEDSPVYVNTDLVKWEKGDTPRRCGISAFGFSGTNCHLILEEAPEKARKSKENTTERPDSPQVLTLSAKSEESFRTLVAKYKEFLNDDVDIDDVCHTANTGRGHYEYRLALIANNKQEFKSKLEGVEITSETSENNVFYGKHKVVFDGTEAKNGELTKKELRKLNKEADDKVDEYIESGKTDVQLLKDICTLYIKGADVNWDVLYADENVLKTSVPTYPFEKVRCWLDVPGAKEDEEGNIYYTLGFKEEVLKQKSEICGSGSIVVFKDKLGKSDQLVNKLEDSGRNVIEVSLATDFEKISSDSYTIGDKEEDYVKLFEDLKDRDITDIIHMMTLKDTEVEEIEHLENAQRKGIFSIYYLARAIGTNKIDSDLDLVIITQNVNSITGEEKIIEPENAPMFALGKAIVKEYRNISIRCMDIDSHTTVDEIYDGFVWQQDYRASYRNGVRYIEEFKHVDVENSKKQDVKVKENGVYIITGGMGGIGFETSKYLADTKNVKLGLITRTQMPERSQWDELLRSGQDKKICKRIETIQEIESKGATVECLSADVSNFKEMEAAIKSMREKYGKIDGVIHGAGVAGDGYISRKDEQTFTRVIKPKVYGTWILDDITKEDDLDFFIMFSSIATALTVQGQGDYAAANSYMDSYGEYRSSKGKKTLTINWTSWKETGMAVNHGVNSDTIFKAIYTDMAIEALDKVISRDVERVLIGQLNLDSKMVYMLEKFPFELSHRVKKDIALARKRLETEEKSTETEKKIAEVCREILGVKEIDVDMSFLELGADSIMLANLNEKLKDIFPGKVTVAKIFAHPTISKLAEYVDGQEDKESAKPEAKVKSKNSEDARDIAIIGMSARVPGADNPEELWHITRNEHDEIKEFPRLRKRDIDNYLIHSGVEKDSIKYMEGGYLQDIDKFDHNFFRITPKEASLMDPNQRLFLECVWGAIEDAGYGGNKIVGSNTGMYVGYGNNFRDNYGKMVSEVEPEFLSMCIPGNIPAIIPSRASYVLDLKGPSILIDTACSSSLVSVHLACKALREGECDMAIAGGVKLHLLPMDGQVKLGIEASDGRTRAFDDSSDGTGIGEGVGAVLLKPLAKAKEDGDNIYAVIKGSAVNQDGTSAGITAPNASAQTEVILDAWEDAGINPETISYIESHGTGTKLGDPIEIEGLTQAFRKYTDRKQFCGIGSVKTNLGHLFEAAGVTGLIKSVMSLKNKELTTSLHFDKPNHRIDFEESPVYVNTRLSKWEKGNTPRRCGISAFGFSGTNCHMILEEAPEELTENPVAVESQATPKIITLSAKSETSLKELVSSYKKFLENDVNIDNVCYTANTGRGHYEYRIALIADSKDEFKSVFEGLSDGLTTGDSSEDVFYGEHKIVFEGRKAKDGEFTKEDIKALNKQVDDKVREYVATGRTDIQLLRDICTLYVQGANINWEELYKETNVRKISLPTYPFERVRCWFDVPNYHSEIEGHFHYELGFKEEELQPRFEACGNGDVVIFRDKYGRYEEIANKLKENKRSIIDITIGEKFEKNGSNSYVIGDNIEDYTKLFKELKDRNITDIIHMSTLKNTDIEDIDSLEDSQRNGVYSLYYIVKGMYANDIRKSIGLVLVSDYVNSVTGEERVKPENAPIFALGKAVTQEYPGLKIRCMDIDDNTTADEIFEGFRWQMEYRSAYRNGTRYIEEFRSVDMDNNQEQNVEIKENGAYIVTGGMGGIGVEISKYLADTNNAKLGLINRTKMPDRDQWEEILKKGQDKRICKKIKIVREIEAKGATVELLSADVSNYNEMKTAIDSFREKYGKIDGVVHGAGVAGDGYIVMKDEEVFTNVLTPKIYGTWILDHITKEDNLDFFVMFSSLATVFTVRGQGDYSAANSYMDSYAEHMTAQGKKSLTINWVPWKETGMAVNHGAIADTAFKAIYTNEAIRAFDEALRNDVFRVVIGEITLENEMIFKFDKLPFKLSEGLIENIEDYKKILELNKQGTNTLDIAEKLLAKGDLPKELADKLQSVYGELQDILQQCEGHIDEAEQEIAITKDIDVKLTGRDNDEYTQTEIQIAKVWSEILGIKEFSIEDNYFEIGGDSIKAIQIASRIQQPDVRITVNDMLKYQDIASLAEYIDSITKKDEEDEQEGKIALTPYQKVIFEQQDKGEHIKTIMLENPDKYDENNVKLVIEKLIEQHDALRIVFKEENDEIVQYYRDGEEGVEFETIDLTKSDDYDKEIKENIDRIKSTITPTSQSLIKFGLFKTLDVDYLLVAIHPLISDEKSMGLLIEDFNQGYSQILQNENISFSEKGSSFKSWSKKLKELANSKEFAKETEYWNTLEEMDTESLPIDKDIQDDDSDSIQKVYTEITEEDTEILIEEANEVYNTQTNDILLTALGMAVESFFRKEKVFVNIHETGREEVLEDIDVSKTVGQFDYTYPMILDMTGQDDMSYMIKTTKENIRRIPNKGVGYGLLKGNLKPEISFRYLGECEDVNENIVEDAYLDILPMVKDGKLIVEINYNTNKYEEETVVEFADYYIDNLLDIIDHCISRDEVEFTASDLGNEDLSIEEVDDILDLFE